MHFKNLAVNNRILIVDDLHPAFMQMAEAKGYQCHYMPQFKLANALEVITEYSGLAIRSKFEVDKAFIDKAANLKFIARAGAGIDNIDGDYAAQKGIVIYNAPEGNADAVGEHAVGLLLALINKFNIADAQVRHGHWLREENRGFELKGKTVGIIGYGHMGQSFARKLSGFECNVIAYDKYKTGFTDAWAREVSMEEIVKYSDVLSLHVPLTKETRYLVDDEYLLHFKKPFFLINTSRGKTLRVQALLNAINSGKISGAGLDVLETEKFPALEEEAWYAPLAQNQKVILTPHVAGWTYESYRKISEVLGEKLPIAGL